MISVRRLKQAYKDTTHNNQQTSMYVSPVCMLLVQLASMNVFYFM